MLDNIFNMDNLFFKILNRISDVFILSIIYVISCIPIITIGAATTALYYTAINAISREDGYVFKMYCKSFKANFKQSTIMWVIMMVVGAVLTTDVYFWFISWTENHTKIAQPLLLLSVVLSILYVLIFTYVFPLLSKFDNTIGVIFRNSFLLSIKYFPRTILLISIPCLIISTIFISGYGFLFVLILGSGTMAYLQAFIFRSIFKHYIPEKEEKVEGGFNFDDGENIDKVENAEETSTSDDNEN